MVLGDGFLVDPFERGVCCEAPEPDEYRGGACEEEGSVGNTSVWTFECMRGWERV